MLAVSVPGYFAWRSRPPAPRTIRHAWLTDVIREVHVASRQTYGSRRVHAELTLGRGIIVGYHAVELLMRRAGIQGITGRPKYRCALRRDPTATDLADRRFARDARDQLWVTDITEHPTREAKLYCAVDARRVLPPRLGLVDRHLTDCGAGHQRPGHGDRDAPARRQDHPFRSGRPIHVLGVLHHSHRATTQHVELPTRRWAPVRESVFADTDPLRNVRRHDLRHAAITSWLNAGIPVKTGVPVKTAQAWSGHKTASVLLDTYLGVMRGDEDVAVERYQAFLTADQPNLVTG